MRLYKYLEKEHLQIISLISWETISGAVLFNENKRENKLTFFQIQLAKLIRAYNVSIN